MPFERSHAPEIEELNELFDGYEFKSLIAIGGMGAVYLAEQKSLERSVAIKILPRRYSRSETFFEAFTNEAKIIAKLNHQNLVAIHDFGVVGELPYLVMEYASGQSLEQHIQEELLGVKEAAQIILKLCFGVRHAHNRDVVHRDIKPANIILTSDGEPKLVDFGIAKQCGYLPYTSGDLIMGTAGFAAPEMTRSPHLIDARSDIFAIGATLCQLLTGYTPDNLIKQEIDKRHLLGPLYPVVFRAIRTDPKMRFASIVELEDAIVEALEHAEAKVKEVEEVSLTVTRGVAEKPLYNEETILNTSLAKREALLLGSVDEVDQDVVLAGRYRLFDCLRSGERVMVYRAQDLQMGRPVKLRLFFKSERPDWSVQFLEILADLTRVEHPNIPKILDGGLYEAGAFIVYAWENGERIQDWLDKEMDYESYYAIALQVMDSLEVASHYGFHHYSLNTFSVIREARSFSSGRYFLMDVGVSEVMALTTLDKKALPGVRTEWAAPEQFEGRVEGEKTTIYIFAQLMLTLVLRGHPLVGMELEDIKQSHKDGVKTDIGDYRDDLPGEFVEWLHRIAEPKVEKRFSTLREARKALPLRPSSVRL